MKFLYSLTVALASALLFCAEPMAARELLPLMGGSSFVWLSALAFFQAVLLLGYAYSVLVAKASRTRPALWLTHLLLMGLAALALWHPPAPTASASSAHPQWHTVTLLASLIGLPFFVLSSTSPLLQAWYARREGAAVPYRLFGLSNLFSLAALAAYPLLIEPHCTLNTQWRWWRAGFLLYGVLVLSLTLRMRAAEPAAPVTHLSVTEQSSRQSKRFWFALPFVASLQLAAVTEHLTQDVASLPLLWIVPLFAYLLSFVFAFELPQLYRRGLVLRLLAVLLFSLGYLLLQTGTNVPIGLRAGFFTVELFLASWFCHAELFALRPAAVGQSTRFYLYLAASGAAGTAAVVLLSPLLTETSYDLPTSFLITAALVLAIEWKAGWLERLVWAAAVLCGVYLLGALRTASLQDALFRGRNFYGSLRITETQAPPQALLSRTLYNGAIQHGMEWFSDAYRSKPLTYYTPGSGVGLALDHCCTPEAPRRVGIIGLGAGTLAAYGRPGDQFRFYEINPLVTDVAQHLFTFTRNSPATVSIVPGDARLSLAMEEPQHYDVLVVDAFTGDSIPTHLLTQQAMMLYTRNLAPGGVLAFHVSNQYLDLAPVIARLAEGRLRDDGQQFLVREVESGPREAQGESRAAWVLLSRSTEFFTQPALAGAHDVATRADVPLWTDGFSSLLPILSWQGRP